ncbi:MAG: glycosyl hydrolase [Blastopirellula sp.]|nr:MAG: glycosyl hydrolase [Blastopirellula sp.]
MWKYINAIVTVLFFVAFLFTYTHTATAADDNGTLNLIFLGDKGHHKPADRAAQLIPVMQKQGINIEYTEDLNVLSDARLAKYDGLIIYANIAKISPEQESALLKYVTDGGGLIPLHCATYCFLNSSLYIDLVGGQFKTHGGEIFTTEIAEKNHPIMQGFSGFESWDETYVHHKHNDRNRIVLEYRVQGKQAEGQKKEPWTWVRTHGKGRIFYTAWGHDARTWSNPGFNNLVERGIRWAVKDDPSKVADFTDLNSFDISEMTAHRTDVKPFKFIDVGSKIPNYTPGAKWGTQEDPNTKMQMPLPAEESIKHFVTPEDFAVDLYADENNFQGKPIAMNWDEDGRLWICETVDYPNELQPAGKGRDRIRICEDTNGDHKADKFTLFAENLSIPTAICPYRGGVIVQNGVETLYLKDTNGDGKADVRKVLISGWALGDTHGGVSNLRYGLDNWIWGMQGYNNSQLTINGEKQQAFRMGFFRFKLDQNDPPRVTKLEFIRSTNNNTWGLGISEEGLIFGSTANRNPSVYMPIANRYYESVRGWGPQQLGTIADNHLFDPVSANVRQVDQHGGYTAGAGHELYTARVYPKQWWNKTAFVCGPTGKLIGTFVLKRNGADYTSTSPINLVASFDEWSAPIAAQVGPDGNVWFLDWYNYIIQHNPTPHGFERGPGNAYVSDLRDKKHGRIYRVVYQGEVSEKNKAPQSLSQASNEELVKVLSHPTMQWRLHAQRLLVARNAVEVQPQLSQLVSSENLDEIGLDVGAIHALRTLEGLGLLNDNSSLLALALNHSSAGVRRVALESFALQPGDFKVVQPTLSDKDDQVRLAALLSLTGMSSNQETGQALAMISRRPSFLADRWIADAVTSACAAHAVPYIEAIASGKQALPAKTSEIVTRVAEHIARGNPDATQIQQLIAGLSHANSTVSDAVLSGLAQGWQKEHAIQLTATTDAELVALLSKVSPASKGKLIRLGNIWGSKQLDKHAGEIVQAMMATVLDADAKEVDRLNAAEQIIGFRPSDNETAIAILEAISPQESPEFISGILKSLAASSAPALGKELAAQIPTMTPAAKDEALRLMLGRPTTTVAFLNAVEAGTLPLSDLKLDQKQALSDHPDRKIRGRARKLLAAGGGLPNPDREKVLKSLFPITLIKGDVARGKEMFKKHCTKCHMHSGEGNKIGPDLTGMAVHPKVELLTHIIDPSRSVEGNFRTYTVMTEEGRILTGMLTSESRTAIELADTEGKRHSLQRSDIEKLVASKKSLMPDGFEKQVTKQELTDLLEFLTAKGKYLPLPLDKVATAISTKGLFHTGDNGADRMIFSDWKPKLFEGVPFVLTDPRGKTTPNLILLYGPQGTMPPKMPKSVELPLNSPAKAIHFLSGVSGWGHPASKTGTVSMIVRLHYQGGKTEDHPLLNGVHFADYIRKIEVPESKFAFALRTQQMRYLAVYPKSTEVIERLELVKGSGVSSPIVMAITVEQPE